MIDPTLLLGAAGGVLTGVIVLSWLILRMDRHRRETGRRHPVQRFPGDPRIGPVSDRMVPHLSHCERCLTNWAFVVGHTTLITPSRGVFPLCTLCWGELTPARRLPYYQSLFNSWGTPAEGMTWTEIEAAVLREADGGGGAGDPLSRDGDPAGHP